MHANDGNPTGRLAHAVRLNIEEYVKEYPRIRPIDAPADNPDQPTERLPLAVIGAGLTFFGGLIAGINLI